jgi:glycosyltransferase involved in cell wall biosynthesis
MSPPEKIRIAYIASIDTELASGPANHIKGAVEAMARSNDVELWHATSGNPFKRKANFAFPESLLPFPAIRGGWRMFELSLVMKLAAEARRFDILYIRTSPSRVIGRALAHVSAFKVLEMNGLESIGHRGFPALAKAIDLILVTSEVSKRNLIARFPELAPKVQAHFQVGVDASLYFPTDQADARRALGLRQAGHYLLHTSGFQPHHDFETMFSAIKRAAVDIADLQLLLVGDGPRRAEIARLAAEMEMGELVRFVGAIPQLELRHWISASDACANPMTREKLDECGNFNALKTYEYVACGTPAIESFTPTHPVPDWARQHLLLVPAGEVAALADAVTAAVRQKSENREALEAARAFVISEFAWDAIAAHSLGRVAEAWRARQCR